MNVRSVVAVMILQNMAVSFIKNKTHQLSVYINIAGEYVHSTNLSLVGSENLRVTAEEVYHCQEVYVEWNIVRTDGEIEMYNATPQEYYYSYIHCDEPEYNSYLRYSQNYPENGLSFFTRCRNDKCYMRLRLSPRDMRYNGAQFTCTFSLPECGTTNITDPITVYIQGKFLTPAL